MIISGTPIVDEVTIQDLFQKESQNASSAHITKQVTYQRQKDNWFVVSGLHRAEDLLPEDLPVQ